MNDIKTGLKSDAEELIESIYEFKREKCEELSLIDKVSEVANQLFCF